MLKDCPIVVKFRDVDNASAVSPGRSLNPRIVDIVGANTPATR